jgi:hypothetical protein
LISGGDDLWSNEILLTSSRSGAMVANDTVG